MIKYHAQDHHRHQGAALDLEATGSGKDKPDLICSFTVLGGGNEVLLEHDGRTSIGVWRPPFVVCADGRRYRIKFRPRLTS